MQSTLHYGLLMPAEHDRYNVSDFNHNSHAIDEALNELLLLTAQQVGSAPQPIIIQPGTNLAAITAPGFYSCPNTTDVVFGSTLPHGFVPTSFTMLVETIDGTSSAAICAQTITLQSTGYMLTCKRGITPTRIGPWFAINPPVVSQVIAEAGTSTAVHSWTPERVRQTARAQIVSGTYTGNNSNAARTINIGFQPRLVIVRRREPAVGTGIIHGLGAYIAPPRATGFAVFRYTTAVGQWNNTGETYDFTAFR